MDAPSQARLRDSVSLRSVAYTQDPSDCNRFLKNRKMLKFMGKQDRLAVAAACIAAEGAQLDSETLAQRTGLYMVTGHIPFNEEDILPLAHHSVEEGVFSMERFTTDGLDQVNPLLTFRCLPNMPIFHVSYNLGIEGPSQTCFPGLGQFYQVLQEALWALADGHIEVALVGAVADQNNFLVDYHWKRQGFEQARFDASGFLCLAKGTQGLAHLKNLTIRYNGEPGQPSAWGPVDLIHHLSIGHWSHRAHTLDGFQLSSEWLAS